MSVFLYKCKGSATVRTYMITVTITCCQNDNRDIKNRVQQFSICSMPYTNEHLYYSLWWRCGLQRRGGAGETGKAAGSNSVIMLCVSDAESCQNEGVRH